MKLAVEDVGLARELVRARLFGEPLHAVTVGRYEVLRLLGQGGAGVVYEARDPVLRRPVAIKVLRADRDDGSETAAARLRREAKALAQLHHPNVVRVFDVGNIADSPRLVYIAMELATGGSLREQLDAGPWPFDRALPVLLAMARGLAAAHERGIVHRDFKPENVLFGSDGRVRVADFGLARPVDDGAPSSPAGAWSSSGTPTASGQVAGTPGYIAPEVLGGARPGPRSDQFAFFVTAYEVLHGSRPFRATTPEEWLSDVRTGIALSPSAAAALPRGVAPAIARGLHEDPQRRFASMDEAMRALDPKARRRRWWFVGLGAAAALAAAMVIAAPRDACGEAGDALADAWRSDRPRVEAVVRDFDDELRVLDAWVDAWARARTAACHAMRSGSADEQRLTDRSVRCLDRRRAAFDAAVSELIDQRWSTSAGPGAMVVGLPQVAPCQDPEALTAAVPLPAQPRHRAEAEAIRSSLALVALRGQQGHAPEAAELARRALAWAERLGDPYVLVEAQLEMAMVHMGLGDRPRSEAMLSAVVDAAEEIRHDAVVVRAIAGSIMIIAAEPSRADEAQLLIARGEAALRRVGSPPRLVGWLETAQFWLRDGLGEREEAIEHANRAIAAIAIHAPGAIPSVREGMAITRHEMGDSRGALSDLAVVLARKRELYGDDNLEIASLLRQTAIIEYESGHLDDALTHAKKALATAVGVLGARHPKIALYHDTVAAAYGMALRAAEARESFALGIDVARAAREPDQQFLCQATVNIAMIDINEGDGEPAAQWMQDALPRCRDAFGPTHPTYGFALAAAAEADYLRDDLDGARRRFTEALAIAAPDSPERAWPLGGLARIALNAGNPEEAIAPLAEAVALWDRLGHDDLAVASDRFDLARALWESGRDKPRARELVARVRQFYERLGEPGRAPLATIEAWQRFAGMRPR